MMQDILPKISIRLKDLWRRSILITFIALSINLESQAGSGGSWDICNGFDPSDSSILIVTL